MMRSMNTTAVPKTFTRAQKETVHIVVRDRDGVIDTTTPVTWSVNDSSVCGIQAVPGDDRSQVLIGKIAGSTTVLATCPLPSLSGGSQTLTINVAVSDSPDLSGITATFDDPVAKGS